MTFDNDLDKLLSNHSDSIHNQKIIKTSLIISASRRTDILAFYADWFINRIRAGFCTVPNPFNINQISKVSLRPEDVEVIVFWTRNPRPIFPYLKELDDAGFRYYFQYTILNNPRLIDPKSPSVETSIKNLHELASLVGSERVIWRYDPVVFSKVTDSQFHLRSYKFIAEAIKGQTKRSVISIMDEYAKAKTRLTRMGEQGAALISGEYHNQPWFDQLMRSFVSISNANNMEIVSCAEEINLEPYGIEPGKCVDVEFIQRVFGIDVHNKKDPYQREECGCVISKDIGVYDTCLYGCQYCYASRNFGVAKTRHREHDPSSPSIIKLKAQKQLDLF